MFDSKMLLVILAIALIVFGTKRLRSIGSDLGAAVKGFKSAMNVWARVEGASTRRQAAASAPAPVGAPKARAYAAAACIVPSPRSTRKKRAPRAAALTRARTSPVPAPSQL